MTLAMKMWSAIHKILGELDLSEAPPCTKNIVYLILLCTLRYYARAVSNVFGNIKNKGGISSGKVMGENVNIKSDMK
jgi:hypothetical protein